MTAPVDAFVDAEGLIRTFINSLTADVVGEGNPLAAGVHLGLRKSGWAGSWAVLSRIGGNDLWLNEAPSDLPRLTASIFGVTREAAAKAAVAYANALRRIPALRPVIDGYRLVTVTDISGPLFIRTETSTQYLVDATVGIVPAT